MRFSLSKHFIIALLIFSSCAFADRVKWSSYYNADVTGGILVDSNYIYLSAMDSLSKLQMQDGKTIWSIQLKGRLLKPVKAGSFIVAVSKEGTAYIVSSSTKSVVKTVNISGSVLNDPLAISNNLYLPTSNGIVALNVNSGKVMWTANGCVSQATPLLVGDRIFAVCDNGYVKFLSASSGQVVEETKYKSIFWKSSPALSKGKIFIGSFDGKVYAVSQQSSKSISWVRNTIDGSSVSSDIVIDGDDILICTAGGKLYSLGFDGKEKWHAEVDSEIAARPIITPNGIYAITDSGTFYGMDRNGNINWVYETGLPIKSDAYKKGSMIYFVSKNGTLAALSTSSCNIIFPSQNEDVSGIDVLEVEVDAYADTKINSVQVMGSSGRWIEAELKDGSYIARIPSSEIPLGESEILCRVASEDGFELEPYSSVAVIKKNTAKNMIVEAPSNVGYGSSFKIIIKDENGALLDHANIVFGTLNYRNVYGEVEITPPKKGTYNLEVRRAGYKPYKSTVTVGDDYTIFGVAIIITLLLLSVFYVFYKRWMEE